MDIIAGLAELGIDDIDNRIAYANGIISMLEGKLQDNVMTTDIKSGLQNTGLTEDDMRRYCISLDDNLKQAKTINPQLTDANLESYKGLYMAFMIEIIKHFAVDDKYRTPDDYIQLIHQRYGSQKSLQAIGQILLGISKIETLKKGLFVVSLNNPSGISDPRICPRIYVYNSKGKARLFVDMSDVEYMIQNDRTMLSMITSKENRLYVYIFAGSILAISIVVVLLILKFKKKYEDKRERDIAKIEAVIGDVK